MLTRRLRKFVTTEAAAAVRNLDEKTLRGIASSLADQKLEPDRRLYDRAGRHWEELRRTRDSTIEGAALAPNWNRRYQTAAALNALTLSDVRDLGGRRVGRQLRGRGLQRAGRRATVAGARRGPRGAQAQLRAVTLSNSIRLCPHAPSAHRAEAGPGHARHRAPPTGRAEAPAGPRPAA